MSHLEEARFRLAAAPQEKTRKIRALLAILRLRGWNLVPNSRLPTAEFLAFLEALAVSSRVAKTGDVLVEAALRNEVKPGRIKVRAANVEEALAFLTS